MMAHIVKNFKLKEILKDILTFNLHIPCPDEKCDGELCSKMLDMEFNKIV